MRTEKAWYWLAAGVLALGLNGAYQDGQLGWAHVLVDRAAASVERIALRGEHFVTMAEVMLGREPHAFARTEAAIQRVQQAILQGKHYVIDFDLRSFLETASYCPRVHESISNKGRD